MLFAAVSALSLVSVAAAQMTVQVGSTSSAPGGIFQFIPNTLTAPNGTVITFKFIGAPGNHTVTQSTFADPCDPAPGGFDSGWVFLPSALSETPEFNLTITNDAKPIWFFCKQTNPAPGHCEVGMVGAINAPSTGNTFSAFQTNAKAFNKTSGQGQGGLVGIGASASAGVGPVPSPGIAYTGVPLASSGASSAASSGGAAATPTSPAGGTPSKASSASSLAANSVLAMFAAALGFVLA